MFLVALLHSFIHSFIFSFSFSFSSESVLVTKCAYYSNSDYDYKQFVKISDIKNSQPDGYILRIILYIQGARDGNVLLSTSDHPNYERDFVYEFGKRLFDIGDIFPKYITNFLSLIIAWKCSVFFLCAINFCYFVPYRSCDSNWRLGQWGKLLNHFVIGTYSNGLYIMGRMWCECVALQIELMEIKNNNLLISVMFYDAFYCIRNIMAFVISLNS